MRLINHIPAWIRNKYFLSFTGFVIWMLFFDPRDIYSQLERGRELRQLEASRTYYEQQIAIESTELQQLRTDPSTLEKYAREKYLMKRENEDIYLVPGAPKAE